MQLKNELIAINSQSQQQLKAAMFHISQHLIFLLKNAQWTYATHYPSYKRMYTENSKKELTEITVQEYEAIKSLEKNGKLINLKEISEFYRLTRNRVFDEHRIGKYIPEYVDIVGIMHDLPQEHREISSELLESKGNLNIQDEKDHTMLMSAAANGHRIIAHELITAKASVDIQDKSGNTALILAAAYGHREIVLELIEAKADLDLQTTSSDHALILGIDKAHHEIALALIAAKANLNLRDRNGSTALILASDRGYLELVHALIAGKAKRDLKDKEGYTALTSAVVEGHRAVVQALIEAGANLNLLNLLGKSSLGLAIIKKNLSIVSLLLRNQALSRYPNELFSFLKSCDQRDPDVLVSLQCLCYQLEDGNFLDEQHKKLYIKVKTYIEQLTRLTNTHRSKVVKELEQTMPTFPSEIVNLIAEYDSPLEAQRLMFFTPSKIDSLLPACEQKEVRSLDDKPLIKFFNENSKDPLAWNYTGAIDRDNFVERMHALPQKFKKLILSETKPYTLVFAEKVTSILALPEASRKQTLYTPEQIALFGEPTDLIRCENVVIAILEGLITREQAANMKWRVLNQLFGCNNGLLALRTGLLTIEQANNIPAFLIATLLSPNGILALRNGFDFINFHGRCEDLECAIENNLSQTEKPRF